MRWFFFLTAHFTFFAFPLISKCNRAKGCASGPMDVTSVVALQFREARPVSVISLWETLSLEAKPSFLTFFSSDEQFSSRTWRFFLAFNSVSIVGIAFSGRPSSFWRLDIRVVREAWPELRTNSAATDLHCHCLKKIRESDSMTRFSLPHSPGRNSILSMLGWMGVVHWLDESAPKIAKRDRCRGACTVKHADVAWLQLWMFCLRPCWNSAVLLW